MGDVPFDDSSRQAGPAVTSVGQAFDRLGEVLAQHEANSLARQQQMAQGIDETLQRLNASFGHLASAMSKALAGLQGEINSLESRLVDLEKDRSGEP